MPVGIQIHLHFTSNLRLCERCPYHLTTFGTQTQTQLPAFLLLLFFLSILQCTDHHHLSEGTAEHRAEVQQHDENARQVTP